MVYWVMGVETSLLPCNFGDHARSHCEYLNKARLRPSDNFITKICNMGEGNKKKEFEQQLKYLSSILEQEGIARKMFLYDYFT